MSSRDVWPDSLSRLALSARLRADSSVAISRFRSPRLSQAPDCTSDSSTLRFTSWIAVVLSHRSSSDLNEPSDSRSSTIDSTACWPTFLIAARPNRMRPPAKRPSPPSPRWGEGVSTIEKSALDALMSGGNTSMPLLRQSTIAVATLSAEPSMWISSDVMYSNG